MEPAITADLVVAYAQCPRKAYLFCSAQTKANPMSTSSILKQQR